MKRETKPVWKTDGGRIIIERQGQDSWNIPICLVNSAELTEVYEAIAQAIELIKSELAESK